jgi:hypothetical protein
MFSRVQFRVEGTIEERETGRPLAGLIVQAYDKDLIFDDYLGRDITDELGRFSIEFNEDLFRDFSELEPDLYLRVYDSRGSRLLHTTPTHRNLCSDLELRILLPDAGSPPA